MINNGLDKSVDSPIASGCRGNIDGVISKNGSSEIRVKEASVTLDFNIRLGTM